MKSDPRVDYYIERQADFARPILRHLREAIHAACPDCEETLKWSMPHFLYKGEMLAGMAAFKQHATFGFWRGRLVVGGQDEQESAMGQFGRLISVDDLPPAAELEALIRTAMKLTDDGVKPPRDKHGKKPFVIPQDLRAALDRTPAAAAAFDGFPPAALLALVACGPGAQPDAPEPEDARSGNSSVQAQLEAMPEGQRNAVFIRAIRDSGSGCQGVERSERAGEHEGLPLWRAHCSDGSSWTIAVTDSGTAQVINDSEALFAAGNAQVEE